MNPIIEELAKEAGFAFWEDEEWGPGPGHIDWGGDYDKEFQKYSEYLIAHLTQRLLESRLINIPIAEQIREDYGIRNGSED